nr:MAG TPA: hypothetical protein [Caudoviricetes sp.]
MPNDSTVARCPFYIKSNQTTIFCESNVSLERQEDEPERSYAHIFQNAAAKKNFVKEHCGKYPDMNCPYADYMEREYAGGSGNEGKRKAEKSEAAVRKSGKNDCRTGKRKQISARRMRASTARNSGAAGGGKAEG